MQFDEVEWEWFENLLQQFINKYGTEVIKDLHSLHKDLLSHKPMKSFPLTEIYRYIIYNELQKEPYKNLTVNQQAELMYKREGIPKRTFYSFMERYYKKRLKYDKRAKRLREISKN